MGFAVQSALPGEHPGAQRAPMARRKEANEQEAHRIGRNRHEGRPMARRKVTTEPETHRTDRDQQEWPAIGSRKWTEEPERIGIARNPQEWRSIPMRKGRRTNPSAENPSRVATTRPRKPQQSTETTTKCMILGDSRSDVWHILSSGGYNCTHSGPLLPVLRALPVKPI